MISSVSTIVRSSIFKTMSVSAGMKKSCSFSSPVTRRSKPSLLLGGISEEFNRDENEDDVSEFPAYNPSAYNLKKYALVESKLSLSQWERSLAHQVNVFTNAQIKSLRSLKAPIGFSRLRTKKNTDSLASNPFVQGESRIAYHSQLARNVHDLSLPRSATICKTFKCVRSGINDIDRYLENEGFVLKHLYLTVPSECTVPIRGTGMMISSMRSTSIHYMDALYQR